MMSEQLQIHENLYKNGYAPVNIDITTDDLATAIEYYREFLELDEDFLAATRFYNTERGDGDFGQFTRISGMQSDRGQVPDNKDIFHFGANTRQTMESNITGKLPKSLKTFLDAGEELFWAAQRSKKRAVAELDWFETGLNDVLGNGREIGTINDVLRFLVYYPNKDKLAKGHFDRGVCTLALGESHEGLQLAPGQNGLILDCNEEYMNELEQKLQPVEHYSSEAKFFMGAGWNRLPDKYRQGNHDVPLGYHDVVTSPKRVTETIMRWAVVMFCNPIVEFKDYTVPTPAETRPYKQLGRLCAIPSVF